jgi:hypothetical protein
MNTIIIIATVVFFGGLAYNIFKGNPNQGNPNE